MERSIKSVLTERRIVRLISVIALLFLAMRACEYFPESIFELAPESRLPRFIEIPSHYARQDIFLTMKYYVKPWGRTAIFIARNSAGDVIDKIEGKEKGLEPHILNSKSDSSPPGYPGYEIITARETTEIIEHRRMEPVFYINDDPAVREELKVKRGGISHK